MKYLSFDIECCDGVHICEFGYVLIDENFKILERDCITINPESEFKLPYKKGKKIMTMAYPDEVYFNSPRFDFYYERIKKLLTIPDCQILGFALNNDVNFLATAYKKYDKEPVQFNYIDVQSLYQSYTKQNNRLSIEAITEDLGIEGIRVHKSDDDALAVIKIMEHISKSSKMSLYETLVMLNATKKNYTQERKDERLKVAIKKAREGVTKAQKIVMRNIIGKIENKKSHEYSFFTGKKVCISSTLQEKNFNAYLGVIERIYSCGAKYTGKGSDCDIFIDYGNINGDEIRYSSVMRKIEEEGIPIEIVPFEKALEHLKTNKKYLSEKDFINEYTINK